MKIAVLAMLVPGGLWRLVAFDDQFIWDTEGLSKSGDGNHLPLPSPSGAKVAPEIG